MTSRRSLRDLHGDPSPAAEIARYALSAAIVLGLGASALAMLRHDAGGPRASEAEDAVLLDLPPALASSAASQATADGPQQPTVDATPPVAPPKPQIPPPPMDAPPIPQATMPSTAKPVAPALPDTPPPPPIAAQAATAPNGSQRPDPTAEVFDEDAERSRAAKAFSGWQRAMMKRLEVAKRGVHVAGTFGQVEVVFSIDRTGRLLSIAIERSSGSTRLDAAALSLVRLAAPFSAPPTGLADASLSFTIPIVFADRR